MSGIKDIHTGYIKDEAEKIRAQIIGGSIYGEPVKDDDIDAMLVAAYYLGKRKESEVSLQHKK